MQIYIPLPSTVSKFFAKAYSWIFMADDNLKKHNTLKRSVCSSCSFPNILKKCYLCPQRKNFTPTFLKLVPCTTVTKCEQLSISHLQLHSLRLNYPSTHIAQTAMLFYLGVTPKTLMIEHHAYCYYEQSRITEHFPQRNDCMVIIARTGRSKLRQPEGASWLTHTTFVVVVIVLFCFCIFLFLEPWNTNIDTFRRHSTFLTLYWGIESHICFSWRSQTTLWCKRNTKESAR